MFLFPFPKGSDRNILDSSFGIADTKSKEIDTLSRAIAWSQCLRGSPRLGGVESESRSRERAGEKSSRIEGEKRIGMARKEVAENLRAKEIQATVNGKRRRVA